MADREFDPNAARNRVIRQRNVALGLVLAFFVALFFAITVVKMRHVKMLHKALPTGASAPLAGSANGQ